jgi:hypothetical protein
MSNKRVSETSITQLDPTIIKKTKDDLLQTYILLNSSICNFIAYEHNASYSNLKEAYLKSIKRNAQVLQDGYVSNNLEIMREASKHIHNIFTNIFYKESLSVLELLKDIFDFSRDYIASNTSNNLLFEAITSKNYIIAGYLLENSQVQKELYRCSHRTFELHNVDIRRSQDKSNNFTKLGEVIRNNINGNINYLINSNLLEGNIYNISEGVTLLKLAQEIHNKLHNDEKQLDEDS